MKLTIRCPLCRRGWVAEVPEEWEGDFPCSYCFPAPQRVRMARWLIYRERLKEGEDEERATQ